MNVSFFANFPRYPVSKLLYRGFRSLVDSLPDIALIGGFTALFVFMWTKFFIK